MVDPSKMTRHATFTAGRLLCKTIRQNLEKAKFMGYNLEYMENKGWFESEFVVRGDDAAMDGLMDYISRLQEATR